MTTPIPHLDIGRGIDQFHPENKLADGYWQDILNGDPTAAGSLRKRVGYQRYAGSVPMRVASVSRSGTNLDFSLDASFDLTSLRSTPIVVYGRTTAAQTGDFSTTAVAKYYSGFTVVGGRIRVTDSASGSYSDTSPQLTIWGIDWSSSIRAGGAGSRWGWVNHLDTYKSSLETRPICGLGGCIYAARTAAEVGATYGLPTSSFYRRGTKTAGTTVIGPCFVSGVDPLTRARGYVSGTDVVSNWATVTSATYNAGTGYVDFTLSFASMVVGGTLSTAIKNASDWLSVKGVTSSYDGTWLIRAVTQGSNQLTISCSVGGVSDSRGDTTGASGLAGIFTGEIPLTATAQFDVGDRITSATLTSSASSCITRTVSGSSIFVDGVTSWFPLGAAEVFYGSATSRVHFPRTAGGTQQVTNLVRGDMLSVTGLSRRIRVVNVNPSADRVVTITGAAGVATATVTSGPDTSALAPGDYVSIRGSINYSGVVLITAVPSSTTFQFVTRSTATDTGAVVPGLSIGLDEAITLADDSSSTATPHARWIPVEWPAPASAYVQQTRTRHFDQATYSSQNLIRSTMAQNSMFFTDGVNPVMKFDGVNLTRAGLFRWQPHLTVETMPSSASLGSIPNPAEQIPVTATGGSAVLTCTAGDEAKVSVGQRVALQLTGGRQVEYGTVLSVSSGKIFLSKAAIFSGTGNLSAALLCKYYFRLNLIDSNNAVVASAMTSSQDVSVVVGPSSAVCLTLANFPKVPGYDYVRVELQIYRTGSSGTPPYYYLTSLPVSMSSPAGYVSYTDTIPFPADGQAAGSLDRVASVLTGAELGTAWEQPPLAKYISSAGGRLLLANITDYQQADLAFRVDPNSGSPSFRTEQYLHNKKLYIRRNGATAAVTDMADTVVYEFLDRAKRVAAGSYGVPLGVDVASDGSTFTVDMSGSGQFTGTLSPGDWVQIVYNCNYPQDQGSATLSLAGWWQVSACDTPNKTLTFKCKLPPGLSFTTGNVDTTAETITIAGHGLVTGAPISFYTTGTPPGGLVLGQTFFAIVVDANTVKVATTRDNALTGTMINLTTTGTGPQKLIPGYYFKSLSPSGFQVFTATNTKDVPVLITAVNGAVAQQGYNSITDFGCAYSSTDPAYGAMEVQFPRRLAHAINATMSNFDAAQFPLFTPVVVAGGGNDYAKGQVLLRRPVAAADSFTVEHSISSGIQVYFNSTLTTTGTRYSATQRLFPSRLLRSYPNYPEIFDAPAATLASDSDSAIDVNPNDGQQVTGLIPFYGDSNFGAQQKEQLVLVFKERSIYAVNVETKQIQRLETNGVGCIYPRSIAPTKQGILFATDSGLYKINRQMELVYLGQLVERLWGARRSTVADTDIPVATHDYGRRKYKLSYPVGTDLVNSEVLTYDHTRELNPSGEDIVGSPMAAYSSTGAWSRYDSHAATWWCNSGSDSLFGTTAGLVHSVRAAGDITDYRDDAAPIDFKGTYKAMNFGTSGIRKLLSAVVVSFRVVAAMAGTVVRVANEMLDSFGDLDAITLDPVTLVGSDTGTNLSDLVRGQIRSILFSAAVDKGIYFQLQVENSTLDEPVEVTQIDFLVDPLTMAGVESAAESASNNNP